MSSATRPGLNPTREQTPRVFFPIILRFALLLGATLATLFLAAVSVAQLSDSAIALTVCGFLCIASLWSPARGVATAGFVYMLVFLLFHTGLVVAVAVGGEEMLVGGGDNTWVLSTNVRPAVLAVMIGMIAAASGHALVTALLSRRSELSRSRPVPFRGGVVGAISLIIGAGFITAAVLRGGGLNGNSFGYLELLSAVEGNGLFGYGTLIFSMGAILLVASGGRNRLAGWFAFIAFALIALPLGLRGTVLFLLAVLFVLEGKRRRFHTLLVVSASVLALAVVSLLRTTRLQGLSGLLSANLDSADPMKGLAEMGYSIYPVVVVQRWMESGSEPMLGATFFAPLSRTFEDVFLQGAPPANSDYRLFNVEIYALAGPIGGSPVAEGVRNGGASGVVLFLLAIGAILALIDRLPGDPWHLALGATIMLPVLTAVRNSWAPVIPQIAVGLLILLCAHLLGRSRRGALPK